MLEPSIICDDLKETEKLTDLKAKLEQEYNNIAEGTILRSRVQYYEQGEKCTKYFLNLEKSNKIKSTVLN